MKHTIEVDGIHYGIKTSRGEEVLEALFDDERIYRRLLVTSVSALLAVGVVGIRAQLII